MHSFIHAFIHSFQKQARHIFEYGKGDEGSSSNNIVDNAEIENYGTEDEYVNLKSPYSSNHDFGARSAPVVVSQQPSSSAGQSTHLSSLGDCNNMQLIHLVVIGGKMTKKYKIRRKTLTEENFFHKIKTVVGRGHLREFTYCAHPDTITFRYGDTEGAAIFLDSGMSTLNLYPSIQLGGDNVAKKPRLLRNHEMIGKTEKETTSKLATFSKMDYLRYSRNVEIYTTLKKDRARMQTLTGVYIAESCVLNRCTMLCPLCNTCLKMRNGGGLESFICHLRTDNHAEDPLARKLVRCWQENDTPVLDAYEKQRLSTNYTKDNRYCKLSVLEDLMRGDRTSLSMLPNCVASDYYVGTQSISGS